MSLQIKASKAQGDPGLFGFLGKAVGTLTGVATSFIPGPAGAIARGLQRKVFGGGAPTRALPQPSVLPALPTAATYTRSAVPFVGETMNLAQQGTGTAIEVAVDATPAIACPKGYKPNKSGYYRRIKTPYDPVGQVYYIQPKSRCVKIRKRNAANPRAADRAISRIESAKRFAKRMNRVTIRKTCE